MLNFVVFCCYVYFRIVYLMFLQRRPSVDRLFVCVMCFMSFFFSFRTVFLPLYQFMGWAKVEKEGGAAGKLLVQLRDSNALPCALRLAPCLNNLISDNWRQINKWSGKWKHHHLVFPAPLLGNRERESATLTSFNDLFLLFFCFYKMRGEHFPEGGRGGEKHCLRAKLFLRSSTRRVLCVFRAV